VRLASAHFTGFKRFTDARIIDIPETARLVVLAGPNGTGKSSIFDGFRHWHGAHGGVSFAWDETYGSKVGTPQLPWPQHVELTFHQPVQDGTEAAKKSVYVRTAFRNEAEFTTQSFGRMASPLDSPRTFRMIDNDVSVSDNYQRLIMQTIDGIYDSTIPDETSKGEIRDRLIGTVRGSMSLVFPDLQLTGVGKVGGADAAGTFLFQKGAVHEFMYKNLSAGEKAAFDLLLDTVVKRAYYDDTLWCIDEPETHLNTRIQGALLQTLLELLPEPCQLFVASHSIGFMKKAWELAKSDPGSVCFIDLQDSDFDQPVVLSPINPTRDFWQRTLDVALGDLASLVAPDQVVLCEGRPARSTEDRRAAFDATCYRTIFASEFPNTDFLSVGNSDDAGSDRLGLGTAIQALSSGTAVIRVVDRDMRSDEDVRRKKDDGTRVLRRRHIESYLYDDGAIRALCVREDQPDKSDAALAIKAAALQENSQRNKDPDDVKAASGTIYNEMRRLLQLTQAGNDRDSFARDTLAPLLTPGMAAYAELREDIFGE
jgi:hypothetical protein